MCEHVHVCKCMSRRVCIYDCEYVAACSAPTVRKARPCTHRRFVSRPQHTQAGFQVASGTRREIVRVREQQPLAEVGVS